jgi:hypothetical protein
MHQFYAHYTLNLGVIYIRNHCILRKKSRNKTDYFALKFSSIYIKILCNIHIKLYLKYIVF